MINPKTNERIKLLVVSQYYYPEQFRINDMCAEWVRRGYDVTVVTGVPNYPQGSFYEGYNWFKGRTEVHDGVKIIRLPIISRGRSKFRLGLNYVSFVVSGLFWKLFTNQQADIVFSFEVSPMSQVLPAVWFARRREVPCFAYIQDLWPDNFMEITGIRRGVLVDFISRMSDYIYKNCTHILVTSKSFKKTLEERGVPADKVEFWPQYAEEHYSPSKEISDLLPAERFFTIAFTGNIGESQGLEILPKTAILLKEKGIEVLFLIVGTGRGLPELQKVIENAGVSEYFYFLPQQPPQQIPSILAGCQAAFISYTDKPAFRKTLPAKLQSYMACGMPIIASVDGETKDVIEEANCGIISGIEDPEDLCESIEKLLNADGDYLYQLAENAIRYSVIHYDKHKLMNVIDNLFLRSMEHNPFLPNDYKTQILSFLISEMYKTIRLLEALNAG
ncbi:MAG: glycosyltransferase family 4 protein [Lentisphaerae bacterium]|nr:glycosyltransferase family 4 protein [Lentisphaerota bacterium]